MRTFQMHLLEADKVFFEGECESLVVPTTVGQYGILAGHSNMISAVVPGVATRVVDTIGAGDSHIGALMVGLHRGEGPEEALARANRVAATVVATAGAHVDPELIRAAAQ